MLVQAFHSHQGIVHHSSPGLRNCDCGGICLRCQPIIRARLTTRQLRILDMVHNARRRLAVWRHIGEENYHDMLVRRAAEAGFDKDGVFTAPF